MELMSRERQQYFVTRVLDTLLREDFCGMVSQGTVVSPASLPFPDHHDASEDWLRFEIDPAHILWLPVAPARQLQNWRSAAPLVVAEHDGQARAVTEVEELVERISARIDERSALQEEVVCAVEHDQLSLAVQEEWFASLGQRSPAQLSWWQSLLYNDRLASFLDHPYYPTARAKVGLDPTALARYAPEWAPSFQLRWVAVPRQWLTVDQGQLPPWWPDFAQVGLTPMPGHALVPVHPHTLGIIQSDLPEGAQIAPASAISVQPTLSVRTVMINDHPDYHLKLPLFMRSLSYKNIRRIKPGTIVDGDRVQVLLGSIVSREPELQGCCLFTDESVGMSVQDRSELGCILRRYPGESLENCSVLPTAALLAATPAGGSVIGELIDNFFDGEPVVFYRRYIELTLRVHVSLWCLYGIALESNQQNTLLAVNRQGQLRLLLKDNDAARIYFEVARPRLTAEEAALLDELRDPCLRVESWLDIAQLFTTITVQLNLLPFLEFAPHLGADRAELYQMAGQILGELLAQLPQEAVARSQIREYLLESPSHYVKYLFSAGTLYNKQRTGAADINKHYGLTAPNCFR